MKRFTAHYTAIQSLYWITYGLMFNYASLFMLDKGLTLGHVGLLLGMTYGLSAILQPLLARLVEHFHMRLNHAVMYMYALEVVPALLLLLVPMAPLPTLIAGIVLLTLQCAQQPFINSLFKGCEPDNKPMNFGLARGLASGFYAGMSAAMGIVLRTVMPRWLPLFYIGTGIVLVMILYFFHTPRVSRQAAAQEARPSFLRTNRGFTMFLIGISCIAIAHTIYDGFLLQVMQEIGGGSSEMSIAIAVSGISEMLSMAIYTFFSRRVGIRRILMISCWTWLLKVVIYLTAKSPFMIYVGETLQFTSFAFYVPGAVELIGKALDRRDFLRAQSYVGCCFTIGALVSSLAGGVLIERLGLHTTLTITTVFAVIGAILWTVGVPMALKQGHAEE